MINITETMPSTHDFEAEAEFANRIIAEPTAPESTDRFAADLLPWADPYIASLVQSLRREQR